MKRILAIALMLVCTLTIWAQNISVSSFRLLETDLTAINAETMERDQNLEVAALIKVVTTQTGFSFDVGQLGVVKTVPMPGEIWVYVPHGIKKISISHPQLGIIRDYFLPISIASARTYEMVLVTGTVETTIRQARTSQYVVFQLTPPNAFVELDGEVLQTDGGIATKMMKFGSYNYRVQAPNYLPEAGNVTVNDPKNKHVVSVALKPNFSVVTLTVDSDAEIWVNGELKGKGSWTGNLGAGTYEFETRKQNYRSISVTRDIVASSESQTIVLQSPTPIVGEAEINSSPAMADIYIDGKKVGQTPQVISDLMIGDHQYRLVREGYVESTGVLTIRDGETSQLSATLKKKENIQLKQSKGSIVETVKGTYKYKVPKSVSLEQARQEALQKARQSAIEDHLGSHSSSFTSSDGKNNDIASTLAGVWLSDTKEPEFKTVYQDGELWLTVTVHGKIRKLDSPVLELEALPLRNRPDKLYEADTFSDGDNLLLYFKSPEDGYLAVYLHDLSKENVESVFPYSDTVYPVKADEEYYLLEPYTKLALKNSHEIKLSCPEGQVEAFYCMYVVFSPNLFDKLPLTNKVYFNKYLLNYQQKDDMMQVMRFPIRVTNPYLR